MGVKRDEETGITPEGQQYLLDMVASPTAHNLGWAICLVDMTDMRPDGSHEVFWMSEPRTDVHPGDALIVPEMTIT